MQSLLEVVGQNQNQGVNSSGQECLDQLKQLAQFLQQFIIIDETDLLVHTRDKTPIQAMDEAGERLLHC